MPQTITLPTVTELLALTVRLEALEQHTTLQLNELSQEFADLEADFEGSASVTATMLASFEALQVRVVALESLHSGVTLDARVTALESLHDDPDPVPVPDPVPTPDPVPVPDPVPTPDPVPVPTPDPDPSGQYFGRQIIMAVNASQDAVQAAADSAPDRALVMIPFSPTPVNWPGQLFLRRDVGLVSERVDGKVTMIRDRDNDRDLWDDMCVTVEDSDECWVDGLHLFGPRTIDPNGRSIGLGARRSCKLVATGVTIEDYTWAGLSLQFQDDVDAWIFDYTVRNCWRTSAADGNSNWLMGYGIESGGRPANYNRPLFNSRGEAVGLTRVWNSNLQNCRHVIASNNGARYGIYDSLMTQDHTFNGAIVDMHGLAAWDTGSQYAELVGNVIGGGSGKTWVGFGPRGGEFRVTQNQFKDLNHGVMMMVEGGAKTPLPQYHINKGYIWENDYDDVSSKLSFWRGAEDDLKEGRDYYLHAPATFAFKDRPSLESLVA